MHTATVTSVSRTADRRGHDVLAAVSAFALPAAPPRTAGSHTVLVVDDTPEVRELVGEILSEQYRVVYAVDGEHGWQMVLEEAPDLIISDVMMPRVDGHELCRRVKGTPETEAIPFVLLTARAQVSLKIEGLNCGADDYLIKPFHADELLARARALIRLRRSEPELATGSDVGVEVDEDRRTLVMRRGPFAVVLNLSPTEVSLAVEGDEVLASMGEVIALDGLVELGPHAAAVVR